MDRHTFCLAFPLRLRNNSVASTQRPRIGHGHVSHGYVVTWAVAYSLHIVLRPPGGQALSENHSRMVGIVV